MELENENGQTRKPRLDMIEHKSEIEYIQKRTGASLQEIEEAYQEIGQNWLNIIYYLKSKKK